MAQSYAEDRKKMDLRCTALAANAADFPNLEPKRMRLNEVNAEASSLTAEQASLAARKQEVSKRLAVIMKEGNKLVAFVDVCVKEKYGNRAEKLVEFGLQPFRGRPRIVLVGPDGKRLKKAKTNAEPAAGPGGDLITS
jgi:predicted secreted acid phosphatase